MKDNVIRVRTYLYYFFHGLFFKTNIMQAKFHASLVPLIAIYLPEHVDASLPNKVFHLFF